MPIRIRFRSWAGFGSAFNGLKSAPVVFAISASTPSGAEAGTTKSPARTPSPVASTRLTGTFLSKSRFIALNASFDRPSITYPARPFATLPAGTIGAVTLAKSPLTASSSGSTLMPMKSESTSCAMSYGRIGVPSVRHGAGRTLRLHGHQGRSARRSGQGRLREGDRADRPGRQGGEGPGRVRDRRPVERRVQGDEPAL